jgi:hypothetical protein
MRLVQKLLIVGLVLLVAFSGCSEKEDEIPACETYGGSSVFEPGKEAANCVSRITSKYRQLSGGEDIYMKIETNEPVVTARRTTYTITIETTGTFPAKVSGNIEELTNLGYTISINITDPPNYYLQIPDKSKFNITFELDKTTKMMKFTGNGPMYYNTAFNGSDKLGNGTWKFNIKDANY